MAAITTGLSDYHKMIIPTFRSSCTCEPPQNIIYRNYKNFNAQDFINDLEINLRLQEQGSTCLSYDKLTKIFKETTDKHAPQKKHNVRGNQTPFMTRELSKQIMKRSKSKNLCFMWSSRENFLAFKNEKNKCNNMNKYAKKSLFSKVTSKKGSKSFWNAIKAFFTNRGIITKIASLLKKTESLKTTRKKSF